MRSWGQHTPTLTEFHGNVNDCAIQKRKFFICVLFITIAFSGEPVICVDVPFATIRNSITCQYWSFGIYKRDLKCEHLFVLLYFLQHVSSSLQKRHLHFKIQVEAPFCHNFQIHLFQTVLSNDIQGLQTPHTTPNCCEKHTLLLVMLAPYMWLLSLRVTDPMQFFSLFTN